MTFNGFSKIYVEGELENNYGTVRASGSATATSNESIVDADSQAQIIATSVANSQLENDINVIQQTISIAIAKTITGPTLNYNSLNQNISSNTSKKNSIYYQTPAKINDTQIIAKLDNDVNLQQVYTFGPSIPNRWVAVGDGTNTIAYSNDSINWTGIGNSIFTSIGFGVAWNGTVWVAVGAGTNSIAYSNDGINWTGTINSTSIFYNAGRGVAWNGTMWVAVGNGTNSIAYSNDGINWTGTDTDVISGGFGVAWNGTVWVAVGYGTNTIIYSYDGINWTGVINSKSIFGSFGNGVAWNGTVWVAVGSGTNTIAYSYDGINWTGIGNSIFSDAGYGVAWNATVWVATGNGTNSIAYSNDGINWTGIGNSIFSNYGGFGVAGNSKIGSVVVPSQMVLNNSSINGSNQLDICSESYYNTGFTNATFTIASSNL